MMKRERARGDYRTTASYCLLTAPLALNASTLMVLDALHIQLVSLLSCSNSYTCQVESLCNVKSIFCLQFYSPS